MNKSMNKSFLPSPQSIWPTFKYFPKLLIWRHFNSTVRGSLGLGTLFFLRISHCLDGNVKYAAIFNHCALIFNHSTLVKCLQVCRGCSEHSVPKNKIKSSGLHGFIFAVTEEGPTIHSYSFPKNNPKTRKNRPEITSQEAKPREEKKLKIATL